MLDATAERLLRMAGSRFSRTGRGNKLLTLIYHRVLSSADNLAPNIPDQRKFDWQMALLSRNFNVLPLCEAVARLATGSLPERAVSITFDDGYADNLDIAVPILQRHGLQATFFIATGYLDGGRMWNDVIIESVRHCEQTSLDLRDVELGTLPTANIDEKKAAIAYLLRTLKYRPVKEREALANSIASRIPMPPPNDLMLRSGQLGEMIAAGMNIGAHTVTHPILAELDDDTAKQEIVDSKARLEGLVDASVNLFAYPNGKPEQDFLPRDANHAKAAGFSAAVTTEYGVATPRTSPYLLPRFTPWDSTPLKFMARLVLTYRKTKEL